MRAVSTVLDAAIFLLVVGVAVATVVGVPADPPSTDVDRADELAETVATTTARVNYSLGPDPGDVADDADVIYRRSAHGTLASLLADAAVDDIHLDGRRLTTDRPAFRDAVVETVETTLSTGHRGVQIRATWEPYPDGPIRGTVTVGTTPPPSENVSAATVTVASPFEADHDAFRRAARQRGFDGVARTLAESVVTGRFPPDRTQRALWADHPVDSLVVSRYASASRGLGLDPVDPRQQSVVAANGVLSEALADRLETALRSRFESPMAAAEALTVDTVRVTVRTWSP